MTTTVQANVNSTGGGVSDAPAPKLEPKPEPFITRTYRRTFQQYVHNNNASTVPVYDSTNESWKQGWAWIPYTDFGTSMTTQDRTELLTTAKCYRVKEMGFTIKRISCVQQQAKNNTSTTEINNSFVSAPVVMLFKDTNHEIYHGTYDESASITIGTTSPICIQNPTTNDSYRTPFAATLPDGSLRLTQYTQQAPYVYSSGSGYPTANTFDLMWGGDIDLLQTGGTTSYTWKNDRQRWFSPNISGSSAPPGGQVEFTTSLGMIPSVYLMYSDMTTGIPDIDVTPPMMHLIRCPPVVDALGPITVVVELWIEYHCTIEYMPGRYLYNRTADVGAQFSTVNAVAYPTNNRMIAVPSTSYYGRESEKESGPSAKRAKYC